MHKKRVFSGVQPTGNLHLGIYFLISNFSGAFKFKDIKLKN